MIIELQGCSLEIAHIGTREAIEFEVLLDYTGLKAAEAGKMLRETIEQAIEAMGEFGRQFLAFLKTDEGKQLLELYGVGNQ